MYKAKFDFCKKKINANYEVKKKDVKANFNLNIIPPISNLVTKEELKNATATYIHTQAIASDTWVINHNLNKKPSITIVDSADNVVEGAEKYIDANTVEIRFNGAFKGKAYLN